MRALFLLIKYTLRLIPIKLIDTEGVIPDQLVQILNFDELKKYLSIIVA